MFKREGRVAPPNRRANACGSGNKRINEKKLATDQTKAAVMVVSECKCARGSRGAGKQLSGEERESALNSVSSKGLTDLTGKRSSVT